MAAILALSLAAAACGPDLALEKKQELEKLKTERVERVAVEKAQAELAEVETRIAAARDEIQAKQAELPPLEQKRDGLRAAAKAERRKLPEIAAAQTRALEEAKRALETAQTLAQDIARAEARALWARDQVALLARELRADDADWATQRRLATFRELVTRFQKEWEDDPVLRDSAAELVPVGRSEVPPEKAREVASRLRSRFTAIYELPALGVAGVASPPAPEPAPAPARDVVP